MSTAAKRAEEARATLDTLRQELASITELVETNDAHEADIRARRNAGNAKAEELVEARQAAHQARELLKQQEADVTEAEATLEQAETAAAREAAVKRIAKIAKEQAADTEAIREQAVAALDAFIVALLPISAARQRIRDRHAEWGHLAARHLGVNLKKATRDDQRALLATLEQEGVNVDALLVAADQFGADGLHGARPITLDLSEAFVNLLGPRVSDAQRKALSRVDNLHNLAHRLAMSTLTPVVARVHEGQDPPSTTKPARAAHVKQALADLKNRTTRAKETP